MTESDLLDRLAAVNTDLYHVDFRHRLVFDVQKINKRLHIVLRQSEKLLPLHGYGKYLSARGPTMFYTPPEFVRQAIKSRDVMEQLADRLNQCDPKDRILQIMLFEKSATDGRS